MKKLSALLLTFLLFDPNASAFSALNPTTSSYPENRSGDRWSQEAIVPYLLSFTPTRVIDARRSMSTYLVPFKQSFDDPFSLRTTASLKGEIFKAHATRRGIELELSRMTLPIHRAATQGMLEEMATLAGLAVLLSLRGMFQQAGIDHLQWLRPGIVGWLTYVYGSLHLIAIARWRFRHFPFRSLDFVPAVLFGFYGALLYLGGAKTPMFFFWLFPLAVSHYLFDTRRYVVDFEGDYSSEAGWWSTPFQGRLFKAVFGGLASRFGLALSAVSALFLAILPFLSNVVNEEVLARASGFAAVALLLTVSQGILALPGRRPDWKSRPRWGLVVLLWAWASAVLLAMSSNATPAPSKHAPEQDPEGSQQFSVVPSFPGVGTRRFLPIVLQAA